VVYFVANIVLLLSLNVYQVWLVNEFLFLFFMLLLVLLENNVEGLIVYFFFQRFLSFMVFFSLVYFWEWLLLWVLAAKLGLAPFHFWVVLVRVKMMFISNMFVLGLQKLGLLWLFWLIVDLRLVFIRFLVFLGVMVTFISVFNICDLWLLIVYSSVANTRLIVFSFLGDKFISVFLIYLFVFIMIVGLLIFLKSYDYISLVILILLTIPRFILFIYKIELFITVIFSLKLVWFIVVFDILMLVYYFNIIFVRSVLRMNLGFISIMFLVLVLGGLRLRVFVAMNLFN